MKLDEFACCVALELKKRGFQRMEIEIANCAEMGEQAAALSVKIENKTLEAFAITKTPYFWEAAQEKP